MAGIILVLRHLHVWRASTDATSDPVKKDVLWVQLRRRSITSGSISAVGLALVTLNWARDPYIVTALLTLTLILIVLILFMASLDMLSVTFLVRDERRSRHRARDALAREHQRLQKKREQQNEDPEA